MSLQELQEQVRQLSVSDRLTLVSTIIRSLQDTAQDEDWQYLVTRPHPWRRQLYIKGRKLLASTVWQDMMAKELALMLGKHPNSVSRLKLHRHLPRIVDFSYKPGF